MEKQGTAVERQKLHELPVELLVKHARWRFCRPAGRLERDCRTMAREVAAWREKDAWRRVAATWGEFCLAFIGLPEPFVDCICRGAATLDDADKLDPDN